RQLADAGARHHGYHPRRQRVSQSAGCAAWLAGTDRLLPGRIAYRARAHRLRNGRMRTLRQREPNVIPGFGITLGFTTFFLSAIVLLPLSALVLKTAGLDWTRFVEVIASPRALASYRLSFGASLVAA